MIRLHFYTYEELSEASKLLVLNKIDHFCKSRCILIKCGLGNGLVKYGELPLDKI